MDYTELLDNLGTVHLYNKRGKEITFYYNTTPVKVKSKGLFNKTYSIYTTFNGRYEEYKEVVGSIPTQKKVANHIETFLHYYPYYLFLDDIEYFEGKKYKIERKINQYTFTYKYLGYPNIIQITGSKKGSKSMVNCKNKVTIDQLFELENELNKVLDKKQSEEQSKEYENIQETKTFKFLQEENFKSKHNMVSVRSVKDTKYARINIVVDRPLLYHLHFNVHLTIEHKLSNKVLISQSFKDFDTFKQAYDKTIKQVDKETNTLYSKLLTNHNFVKDKQESTDTRFIYDKDKGNYQYTLIVDTGLNTTRLLVLNKDNIEDNCIKTFSTYNELKDYLDKEKHNMCEFTKKLKDNSVKKMYDTILKEHGYKLDKGLNNEVINVTYYVKGNYFVMVYDNGKSTLYYVTENSVRRTLKHFNNYNELQDYLNTNNQSLLNTFKKTLNDCYNVFDNYKWCRVYNENMKEYYDIHKLLLDNQFKRVTKGVLVKAYQFFSETVELYGNRIKITYKSPVRSTEYIKELNGYNELKEYLDSSTLDYRDKPFWNDEAVKSTIPNYVKLLEENGYYNVYKYQYKYQKEFGTFTKIFNLISPNEIVVTYTNKDNDNSVSYSIYNYSQLVDELKNDKPKEYKPKLDVVEKVSIPLEDIKIQEVSLDNKSASCYNYTCSGTTRATIEEDNKVDKMKEVLKNYGYNKVYEDLSVFELNGKQITLTSDGTFFEGNKPIKSEEIGNTVKQLEKYLYRQGELFNITKVLKEYGYKLDYEAFAYYFYQKGDDYIKINKVDNKTYISKEFNDSNGKYIGDIDIEVEKYLYSQEELSKIKEVLEEYGYKITEDSDEYITFLKLDIDSVLTLKKGTNNIYSARVILHSSNLIGNTASEVKKYLDKKEELSNIKEVFNNYNYRFLKETTDFICHKHNNGTSIKVDKEDCKVYKYNKNTDSNNVFIGSTSKEVEEYLNNQEELSKIKLVLGVYDYIEDEETAYYLFYKNKEDNQIIITKENNNIHEGSLPLLLNAEFIGNHHKELNDYLDKQEKIKRIREAVKEIGTYSEYESEDNAYLSFAGNYNNINIKYYDDNVKAYKPFSEQKLNRLAITESIDDIIEQIADIEDYFKDRESKEQEQEVQDMIDKLREKGYKVIKEY